MSLVVLFAISSSHSAACRRLALSGVNNPAAGNGASGLQRCRAAGYVTLAAVAKYACRHAHLARCPRESKPAPVHFHTSAVRILSGYPSCAMPAFLQTQGITLEHIPGIVNRKMRCSAEINYPACHGPQFPPAPSRQSVRPGLWLYDPGHGGKIPEPVVPDIPMSPGRFPSGLDPPGSRSHLHGPKGSGIFPPCPGSYSHRPGRTDCREGAGRNCGPWQAG